MASVKHTVYAVYGSYSGSIDVICDENDDKSVVVAKVKREARLNFLAMCSESYTITHTEQLPEYDD